MTKLLINKLKQDLNAEPSAASEQGKQIKKKFNILDAQLGPNLESMTNFFGNVSGIDKFDLDNLNPFKKEGFIGQEGHVGNNQHLIHKSIDGRIVINSDTADETDGSASEEYKLYKKLNFQKIHTNSQSSWLILWGGILLVLIIIKLYFFISTFLFGKGGGGAKPGQAKPGQAKPGQAKPGQAKPGQAKPAQAKPGQAMAAQAKPGQAMAAQAKPGEVKPSEPSESSSESSLPSTPSTP